MSTSSLNALATAVGPHLFWITSRAAGIAALLLASMSVCIGLLMGGPLRARKADLRIAHEALSLATLAALVVHGLTLLGDSYLHPSLGDIAIPFLSGYRTLWTSIGIVAFWALLVVGLSYYARARIGVQRWRRLHRFAALAWLLGLAHSLGEGTDAGQAWFLAMLAVVAAPAIGLLLGRLLRSAPTPTAATFTTVPGAASTASTKPGARAADQASLRQASVAR
jgi:methionine sulfoxide reductase heme-binding subunit